MMKWLLLIPLLLVLTACGGSSDTRPAPPSLDRSQPIAFSSEFVNVAYSDGVTLQYRSDIAVVRVIDASGNLWESSPHDVDDDPLARGMIRMALSSMLTVTFLSGAGNLSQETSLAASVRQGGASAYLIPGGVRAEFYFPAQRTMIPVEITLENGTMLASINPRHIERIRPADDADEEEWTQYNRNHRLTEIGLLPHFMHAGVRHEGYMLVPDGSGALIYLNNGRPRSTFNQPVYGRDLNNPPRLQATAAQNILMPVFGMKRNNAAAFAVIESGASLANIVAGVSGNNSSFNSVGANFTVRPPASYTVVNTQGVATDILVTSDWLMDVEAVSVRYHFMENGSGYSEMAQLYRQHLISQGMTPSARGEGLPLVLDVFGSVTRRMSVLGIPTNRTTPLTTFEQAGEMADTLKNGGIGSLVVRYNNWLPRGNYSTSPSRFTPAGSLGGRRGFRDFSNSMDNLGVSLYMDVDFATAHRRPFLGFIGTPVIRDITNVPVRQTGFNLDTFGPADEPYPGWWMYSPRSFRNAVDTFITNAKNANISGFNFSILSNLPYSDIGRSHMDRGAAEVLLSDIARDARASFGGLMGDAAGAFWLPHATFVVNTPIGCSGFTLTDVSVPFYQMVLHGYVDFSLPAYNLASDREGMVLRAAETGALLQLSVIAENPALLVDTPLEWLMSPSFDYWYAEVLAAAHRLAPVYDAAAGATIASHRFLAENVTETRFSNGSAVIVNFNHVPHGDIPARDFIVITGGAR
ncbi:MAG: DUF5696 domain-containing protein [Defluviitaleaceae bacterium]|nr:DUF5696 domain-containing protein [Defluviitaleaceae bacterium]